MFTPISTLWIKDLKIYVIYDKDADDAYKRDIIVLIAVTFLHVVQSIK